MNNCYHFAVDIGNSFCKFACFAFHSDSRKNRNPLLSVCVETSSHFDDLALWLKELDESLNDKTAFLWIVSSVNQKKYNSFAFWMKQNRPQDIVHLLTISEIPMTFRYDDPQKLGMDRAIAAFGASLIIKKDVSFFVVDVGTATTIDYIDSFGIFCGGAILPGPEIAIQALMERTEKIALFVNKTEINNKSNSFFPATNTQNAIQTGINSSLVGAVFSSYVKMVAQNIKIGQLNQKGMKSKESLKPAKQIDSSISIPFPSIVITGRAGYSLEDQLGSLFSEVALLNQQQYFSPEIKYCPDLILTTLSTLARKLFSFQSD
ncbi:MAG: type III pantothenate kinase [Planctomycetia bacterium]|nr:type III pantothenate kinase [Planctomycetia bacterium]